MSQAKVDRYKAEKANRKQAMRKQKLIKNLDIILVVLIIAALVGWIGFSVYQHKMEQQATQTTDINLDAISNYSADLNADEEEADAASEETAGSEDAADGEIAADDEAAAENEADSEATE